MRVTGTEIDIWFRPLGREIEHRHDYWQKRLLPLLAADQIREFAGANRLLDQLLPHVNQHEIHREPGTTPHAARQQVLLEKPSVLRPIPACPCWPFVWSQQTRVRIGDDGTVPIATHRQSIDATPRAPSSAAYQAVEKLIFDEKSCENPNEIEGQFFKTWLFQQPVTPRWRRLLLSPRPKPNSQTGGSPSLPGVLTCTQPTFENYMRQG